MTKSTGNFYSRYLFPFKWNHTAQRDEKIRGALDFSRALGALFLSIYKPDFGPKIRHDSPFVSTSLLRDLRVESDVQLRLDSLWSGKGTASVATGVRTYGIYGH